MSTESEVSSLIPINWCNACKHSLFADMTLTLHKRQRFTVLVSCSGELTIHSCPLICLQGQVAKLVSGLFCCWPLLRDNNMATNLQGFTLRSGNRCFAACDCWAQTSLAGKAARQWLLSDVDVAPLWKNFCGRPWHSINFSREHANNAWTFRRLPSAKSCQLVFKCRMIAGKCLRFDTA